MPLDANFCPYCGTPQHSSATSSWFPSFPTLLPGSAVTIIVDNQQVKYIVAPDLSVRT